MAPDFQAYGRDGRLVVNIEVKKRKNATKEWASATRRNMLAHGSLPRVHYFLLVTPEKLFLWVDEGNLPDSVPPNYEIDATILWEDFVARTGLAIDGLSSEGFELLFASFLNEIIYGYVSETFVQQNQTWLIDTGLLDAIKRGQLVAEVA